MKKRYDNFPINHHSTTARYMANFFITNESVFNAIENLNQTRKLDD